MKSFINRFSLGNQFQTSGQGQAFTRNPQTKYVPKMRQSLFWLIAPLVAFLVCFPSFLFFAYYKVIPGILFMGYFSLLSGKDVWCYVRDNYFFQKKV